MFLEQVRALLPNGRVSGANYVAKNPTRADAHEGSFSINFHTAVWADFATGESGRGMKSFATYLGHNPAGYDDVRPISAVVEWSPCEVPNVGAEIIVRSENSDGFCWQPTYVYRTPDGAVQFAVRRVDNRDGSKRFEQAAPWVHKDKPDEIVWRLTNRRQFRTLFGIEFIAANSWPVIVVEGEKTCLALRKVISDAGGHFNVVCWAGGCNAVAQSLWSQLFGREVICIPDRDAKMAKGATVPMPMEQQTGYKAMRVIFEQLRSHCPVLAVMPYTVIAERDGWDFADATPAEALDYVTEEIGKKLIALRAENQKRVERAHIVLTPDETLHDAGKEFLFVTDNKARKPLAVIQNTEYLMANYGVQVSYNLMTKTVDYTAPNLALGSDSRENAAISNIQSLARLNQLPADSVPEYIFAIAVRNEFCPVQEWVSSVPWDGKSRFEQLIRTVSVAPEDENLRDIYLRKWLLSAVAAVFEPKNPIGRSRYFDSFLVLQGGEGVHKTSWFQSLAPSGFVGKSKSARDIEKADTKTQLIRHWITELGETNRATTPANIDAMMAFASEEEDSFRTPYSRTPSNFQRRTVFCGTVNNPEFLPANRDHRRWWVLPVRGLNHRHGIDMQQVWVEVYQTVYLTNENWWLSETDHELMLESNKRFRESDPFEEIFLSHYAVGGDGARYFNVTTIAEHLKIPPQPREIKRLSTVLKRICEHRTRGTTEYLCRKLPAYAGEIQQPVYDDGVPF